MKTILLTLALTVSALTALAQGRISIANDSSRLFELQSPYSGDPSGPIPGTVLPSGKTLVLALYAGTTSGAMSLQTSYALTGANWLAPGRGATKPLTLTGGVPGGVPQYFNIVLTDNNALLPNTIDGAVFSRTESGAYWSAYSALFGGGYGYYGSSGLFQFTPSTSAIAAPPINGPGSTWLTGSINIIGVIPEPSSVTLAGLGAVSLLLFRRRE